MARDSHKVRKTRNFLTDIGEVAADTVSHSKWLSIKCVGGNETELRIIYL